MKLLNGKFKTGVDMKYEELFKCHECWASKSVWLNEEEYQEHIELKEDGLKVICSNCTWKYEDKFKKKEVKNG